MASKRTILAGGLASLAAVAVIGVGSVGAASQTGAGNNLSDKISSAFHLNKADVQKVIDQDHSEHMAQREAEHQAKLDQAVKDGKITSAQKDQLEAKQKELRSFMDTLKDKSESERHTAMKAKLDEFKQWATDNKISADVVGPGHHRGHMEGRMGGHMDVDMPEAN